jgi:predicted ATPase
MNREKKTSMTKSELNKAINKARESGKVAARKEVGEWIEANMLRGPYRTVYSDIFPPMIQRLKEGKPL